MQQSTMNSFERFLLSPSRVPSCMALLLVGSLLAAWLPIRCSAQQPVLEVPRSDDFELNGRGDSPHWNKANWTPLNLRPDAAHNYSARFKVLYSGSGLYVLFDGTDRRITATMQDDFLDLWNEDVYECFLWTDEQYPVYFEYEISPLGYELPILIPNLGGEFLGWRPWHYDGDRKIRKQVSTNGGPQKTMAQVEGWTAEVFIPYVLLSPLGNVPPSSGTRWRANFYRMDHDDGQRSQWDWARVGASFHDYKKFGTLEFE